MQQNAFEKKRQGKCLLYILMNWNRRDLGQLVVHILLQLAIFMTKQVLKEKS